jgi:hypothetical protein
MECLTRLIGIWDQCGPKTTGVKYINDLPGFNLSMADYLTSQEKQTGIEVIQGCINNAADEIETEIRSFLDPRMRLGSIIGSSIVGYFADNKNVKAADAGYLGGSQLELGNQNYLGAYIESVTIFTPNTYTNENLYIYDLTQGALLDTIPFSSTGDQYTEVSINKLYKSNGQFLNLFFCRTAGTSYQTDVIQNGCFTCGWKKYNVDGYLYARSAKILDSADKIQNNLEGSTHSYGISIKYQLVCDSSNFICSLSSRLKMAMFYKSGMAWCDEIIYGKRLNSLTTVQKSDAEKLKKDYSDKYVESMNMVLQNIILPNDICFQCEAIINVKNSIP